MISSLEENLARIDLEIQQACHACGRDPQEITLLAVTKTFSSQTLLDAVSVGLTELGESRVQEAELKFAEVGHIARYHLIGHLQSNKVKKAVQLFDLIQSVDSIELAREISRRAEEFGRTIDCLVEINSSAEEQKYGVAPDQAIPLVQEMVTLPNIVPAGFMTVGPLTDDEALIQQAFRLCADLFQEGQRLIGPSFATLSMGMSSDFPLAIAEGSTMIRIGTALFGGRQ